MPTRKPKKNIGDQVGGWLGGAAKAVGRAAAQNPIVAQNIRYGKAVMAGPTQLAKTAAIDLAAGAAGAGVGKFAQAAVRTGRVVNPVAAARNKLTGREVWLHSSPTPNLSQVNPVVAPKGRPRFQKDTPLTFGTRASQKGTKEYLPEYVREVTTKYNPRGNVGTAGKPQSIYVTSVRKKDVVAYEAAGKWGVSSGPQKVVSEIRIGSKTPDQLTRDISSAVRKAGESFKPQYSKAELARMELRAKLNRIKNPPLPKNRKKID